MKKISDIFKFNVKKFKGVDDFTDKPVVVVQAVESNDEILQKALESVLAKRVHNQLIDMCYTEEELEQTKAFADCKDRLTHQEKKVKWPKAQLTFRGYGDNYPETNFDFTRFVNAIVKGAK